jgi:cytidylate kinase
MYVGCVRGAITIEENTREQVLENTKVLLNEIIKINNIDVKDIISITFTATKDIDAAYPAVGAREIGIVDAALVCFQEMYVVGSLKMCIRAMVMLNSDKPQSELKHAYLKGAQVLRPDLVKKTVKIEAIAVDGPAGSGKSTVAKLVAAELGYIYVDTGAMYRSVGLYFSRNNVNVEDAEAVKKALSEIEISFEHSAGVQLIYLNGEDVSQKVRTSEIAAWASKVAVIGAVREKLVEIQRKIAENNKVVMDGRDIGSNVLKNAKTKIYMDASVDVRTQRRCHELEEKGLPFDENEIRQAIIDRDNNDKNRKLNPLTIAEGAEVIDTSDMSIEEVKNKIIEINNK